MAEKYAVRNLRLCTKDCLCLYVCPTGATDTENSIIDTGKMYWLRRLLRSVPIGRDFHGSKENAPCSSRRMRR